MPGEQREAMQAVSLRRGGGSNAVGNAVGDAGGAHGLGGTGDGGFDEMATRRVGWHLRPCVYKAALAPRSHLGAIRGAWSY